jgi:hypothetical protein
MANYLQPPNLTVRAFENPPDVGSDDCDAWEELRVKLQEFV